jgi:hypothetical protein
VCFPQNAWAHFLEIPLQWHAVAPASPPSTICTQLSALSEMAPAGSGGGEAPPTVEAGNPGGTPAAASQGQLQCGRELGRWVTPFRCAALLAGLSCCLQPLHQQHHCTIGSLPAAAALAGCLQPLHSQQHCIGSTMSVDLFGGHYVGNSTVLRRQ